MLVLLLAPICLESFNILLTALFFTLWKRVNHWIYYSYLWSEPLASHSLRVYRDAIKLTASINVWMSNFETKISVLGKKYGWMNIIKQLGIHLQLLSCSLDEVESAQYNIMQLWQWCAELLWESVSTAERLWPCIILHSLEVPVKNVWSRISDHHVCVGGGI